MVGPVWSWAVVTNGRMGMEEAAVVVQWGARNTGKIIIFLWDYSNETKGLLTLSKMWLGFRSGSCFSNERVLRASYSPY